jgi:protein-S-isoprenylcysteine O-methyltransferase Ste14
MEDKSVRSRRSQMTLKNFISAAIYSPLIVIQFILTIFFYQNYYNLDIILYIGSVVWILSIYFGIAPMIIFKKRGGVPKGKGYVHTTRLVTDGLYSIVRHPQYTAGLLLILAMIMVSQHWIVVIAGIIAYIVFYYDIIEEDKALIKIFGKEYERYMRRVPRTNFILGLVRSVKHKKKHNRVRLNQPEGEGD